MISGAFSWAVASIQAVGAWAYEAVAIVIRVVCKGV